MHKPFLCLLGLFSLLAATSIQAANAPTSLVGKKIGVTISGSSQVEGYILITSSDEEWWHSPEDGSWERASYLATKINSTTINYKGGDLEQEYSEAEFNFNSNNGGTFNFKGEWSLKNGIWTNDGDEFTGTFTIEDFESSEFPSENYFTDDFINISSSSSIWNRGHGYTGDGLSLNQSDGSLVISGKYTGDPEERWFQLKPQSLLPTNKDWIVSGETFNSTTANHSYNSTALVGIHSALDPSFVLEIGSHANSSAFHYWYQRDWQSWGSSVNHANSGEFRIRNDSKETSFIVEWRESAIWKTGFTFNWITGSYFSEGGSSGQVNNWLSLENEYIQPMIEFGELMRNGENESMTFHQIPENTLGISSFSVTEGASETEPKTSYAPTSLAGKLYQTQGGDRIQFLTDTTGTFHHAESNFQQSEVSGITYTWDATGNNSGTLITSLEETSTITFTSEAGGSYERRELSEDKETSQGTFTLTDASTGYAPADLAGDSLISGTTTYVFKDNGKVVVRSPNGSSESAYSYLKTGENEGVLSVSAAVSTFYKLSYSSTGAGAFSEGSSASFDYFVDRTNMPAAKGWMWFDQYPWVYSHREGGWLYFMPSNGKINVYSAQDKAWREMSGSN